LNDGQNDTKPWFAHARKLAKRQHYAALVLIHHPYTAQHRNKCKYAYDDKNFHTTPPFTAYNYRTVQTKAQT
jgi:hypothetical protein